MTFLKATQREQLLAATSNDETKKTSLSYQVMLYNDPMNKRERVSKVLTEIAELKEKDANRVMMEAHTTGKSRVGDAFDNREKAEALAVSLKQQGDVLVEVVAVLVTSEEEEKQEQESESFDL